MRCEILTIGTELLLGDVVDTNSSWIAQQLAGAGITCHFATKVGDNHHRIAAAVRLALSRADAVVCCGGLGPTQDDITREAVADVMGVPLVTDEEVAERIRRMFADWDRPMAANNLRQAQVPAGAAVIPQTRGTAPGLICPLGDRVIYLVPGVPGEMREMVARAVAPDLVARAGPQTAIASRVVRTWGLSESALAERLAERIEALDSGGDGVTLAFLASGAEGIKVRITARGVAGSGLTAVLDDEERRIRSILGPVVFGVDDESMEVAVGRLLVAAGRTLGIAESLTGGVIGARLTEVPGASEWFRGAIVSYAPDVKRSVLGVRDGPVVSGPAAEEMAAGAARVLGASVGLAV
ncbi:MAG: CinA family nicotinamide mononucleotide deamidase-related protein, partial [Acidimicrobiales bacterium]